MNFPDLWRNIKMDFGESGPVLLIILKSISGDLKSIGHIVL